MFKKILLSLMLLCLAGCTISKTDVEVKQLNLSMYEISFPQIEDMTNYTFHFYNLEDHQWKKIYSYGSDILEKNNQLTIQSTNMGLEDLFLKDIAGNSEELYSKYNLYDEMKNYRTDYKHANVRYGGDKAVLDKEIPIICFSYFDETQIDSSTIPSIEETKTNKEYPADGGRLITLELNSPPLSKGNH